MHLTQRQLAAMIDHTLLKPDAAAPAIVQLCAEARRHRFASVCVQPCWVSLAEAELEESGVPVCTVIGFPHGANVAAVKRFEAEEAMRQGAEELDMVISVGAAKSGAWQTVGADIRAVVDAAAGGGAIVKVILECALLTEEEKRRAARIAVEAGAAFLKTSTGFGPHGATVEDVRLLREIAGDWCGVKAAGGIRDLPAALAMIEAGANRIGASAGVALLDALAHQNENTTD